MVGGGFAAAGELILAPARERMFKESLPNMAELTKVVVAELGPDAGMIGAGFVAYETLENEAATL